MRHSAVSCIGVPQPLPFESENLRAFRIIDCLIYGNTAVVTGRARQKGIENSKDYSGENRFTRVYVKQNDHWISVALQVTLVAKK